LESLGLPFIFNMVFSNLGYSDKEAFFSLLDEYFASRPHLLSSGSSSGLSIPINPSVVSSALAHHPNPQVASSASKFSASGAGDKLSSFLGKPAPPAPSSTNTSTGKPAPTGLNSDKKWGSINMSSGKAAVGSVLSRASLPSARAEREAASKPQQVYIPPSNSSSSSFAPPPQRRNVIPAAREPSPPPPPEPTNLGQAVALYDYNTTDKDDLAFKEQDYITVLEHVSADWWKGSLRGKEGIFPANYVIMAD